MQEKHFENCINSAWEASGVDPVREEIKKRGSELSLDAIRNFFPPLKGEPAFDPTLIKSNIERTVTVPEANTGIPFLDLSIKTGIAFIDATFQGNHPKYGTKRYGENCHDGFPPTIIAAVDALSSWGLNRRAACLFRHYLTAFVLKDGTINYRGTSLAELGQLLHTGTLLLERSGTADWWTDGFPKLNHIAERLLALIRTSIKDDGLVSGIPEDDEKDRPGKYFHNNAWISKGLLRWASACKATDTMPLTHPSIVKKTGLELAANTLHAINRTWPKNPADWWLPPQTETLSQPAGLTDTQESSYTNYRYWPELLSSGLLPNEQAKRILNARLTAGGQFCGMTRFRGWLDDWPLADYLFGLWRLGERWDFMLSLFGHIAYHQAENHLTAYEQVTFPPGREKSPYCLPCQLVAARAGRLLVKNTG